jgi:hypothetical protein
VIGFYVKSLSNDAAPTPADKQLGKKKMQIELSLEFHTQKITRLRHFCQGVIDSPGMKRLALWLLFFSTALPPAFADDAKRNLEIDEVLNGAYRSRVLTCGEIKRGFDFDHFMLADKTQEVAIGMAGLKHDLKTGDKICVYGIFHGPRSYRNRYPLIEVREMISQSKPEAVEKAVAQYGTTKPVPAPTPNKPPENPAPEAPPAPRTIEERLNELTRLKEKGVISPEEFEYNRKRILGEL